MFLNLVQSFYVAVFALKFFHQHVGAAELENDGGDPLEQEFGTLKHASLLFRHGDRGPISSFPLDPYKDYPWPGGYGQLINAGKRRLAELGKRFRRRYENFVDDAYSPLYIKIESSDKDRTIMSAECFLYGFYPAAGEQIWLENEIWQPIPVHTIPRSFDNKIDFSGRRCTKRKYLHAKEAADPKYQRVYDEYKTVIDSIVKNTGIEVSNKSASAILHMIKSVAGTLIIYDQNNFTLPAWTQGIYPEPLLKIVEKGSGNITYQREWVRLNAGPFLESVVADMSRKVKNESFVEKLHLYSGHDSTIKNIMFALKVSNDGQPPYGSTLIFELREKNSNNYVTVSYMNGTEKPAYLLEIPGCGLTCTFEQFLNLTKPLISENWEQECNSLSSNSEVIYFNLVTITAMICLLYLFL